MTYAKPDLAEARGFKVQLPLFSLLSVQFHCLTCKRNSRTSASCKEVLLAHISGTNCNSQCIINSSYPSYSHHYRHFLSQTCLTSTPQFVQSLPPKFINYSARRPCNEQSHKILFHLVDFVGLLRMGVEHRGFEGCRVSAFLPAMLSFRHCPSFPVSRDQIVNKSLSQKQTRQRGCFLQEAP